MATAFVPSLFAQMPHSALDRTDARSMVISRRGIVASDQVLASQAAAEILARGGSAADAAIAANAAMGVLEPMLNGIGGDLFVIEYNAKTGKLTGLNSSGWAPEKLTPAFLRGKGFKKMPQFGIYSVTVPGAVAGWWALHKRFGKLPWKELFRPAIYFATHGYPVTQFVAAYWKYAQPRLEKGINTQVFLPGGEAPKVGQIFRNPAYAKALELIANDGPEAFYRGPIAKAILATSKKAGGVMSAADLAALGIGPHPAHLTVTLVWTPQRWVWAGIAVSAAAIAACLALVLLLPPRRRTAAPAPESAPTRAEPAR